VLENDWESRTAIYLERAEDPEVWSMDMCRRMQLLITGRDCGTSLDCKRVRSVFCTPVRDELSKVRRLLCSSSRNGATWKIEYENMQESDGVVDATWTTPGQNIDAAVHRPCDASKEY
jgi:hypothetical protein